MFRRVILLGPNHVSHQRGLLVTRFKEWNTPGGALQVDTTLAKEVVEGCSVARWNENTADEAEHDLELMLPFVHAVLGSDMPILPMIVSFQDDQASVATAAEYLSTLAKDPTNLWVVSSDFCHYGARFGYTLEDAGVVRDQRPLHTQIQDLDMAGVEAIKGGSAPFASYMASTHNTICGRFPISLVLKTFETAGIPISVSMLKYAQSGNITSDRETSVSYVAAIGVERE
ncbi:MEMO1 family protein [Kipferlia bialata]|uniref:MEMO1 family protein n=1 Tax=Kipferlia bialata TaxID=797122 RepID=A0A9K3CT58_9EUKA|nr:MEMO1 family protein [Kipferlia bialata]|eukprot:g3041.t1